MYAVAVHIYDNGVVSNDIIFKMKTDILLPKKL